MYFRKLDSPWNSLKYRFSHLVHLKCPAFRCSRADVFRKSDRKNFENRTGKKSVAEFFSAIIHAKVSTCDNCFLHYFVLQNLREISS